MKKLTSHNLSADKVGSPLSVLISRLTPHSSPLTHAYTLIEVLIASGIFAVLMTMVMGSISINSNLRNQSKTIRKASINARYAIESISRDFRLASNYDISTISDNDSVTIYSYDENGVENAKIYSVDKCPADNINTSICVQLNDGDKEPLTSSDINITKVSDQQSIFDDGGSFLAGDIQPFLEIKFQVQAKLGKKITDVFNQTMETTVASRSFPGYNSSISPEQIR